MSSLCVCLTSRVCSASAPKICARHAAGHMYNGELRELLFGTPISTRSQECSDGGEHGYSEDRIVPEDITPALNGCLEAAIKTLTEETKGVGDPVQQTALEWQRVIDLPGNYTGLAAKRGCLLLALWQLPAVLAHWKETDPELVADLRDRALPLIMPNHLATMGQRPDATLALVMLVSEMWRGVSFGCDPND